MDGIDVWLGKNGIMDRPPAVATVQTLSLTAIYEGLCSALSCFLGLATKLAQSVSMLPSLNNF